ncbi:molecular chaperone [Stenotrophomonas maltophilia]|uniref:Pili assembly chaperone n=1 Tax=Stenotrophomonas maltophilia (strain R551-3) TaxID=391008 RepID=B4SQ28_STRM5|nr:molecular chaperone [Stenotrophomonas maltophilia]ACF50976.1 pili assembly chaperone [Stenotrophomonas maltophilia R551-3]MBA0396756.1 molecular chaperone [Stenotrophomonas maltophilia]MBN5142163.1 molecular chaperone [Stenotrophomonas maltophilia]OCK48614.1 pilus assembly protein [Stenotrophomonas maltophilia]PJL06606.1 pilus assembly protein [Stenotrophomonas maltophilia]
MPMPRGRRLQQLALMVLALPPAFCMAASLQVSPTQFELRANQNAEALWISNSGTEPVQVQVRIYRWQQADGRDQLEASDALLPSPPMQSLAAGQRQLVRLVRVDASAPAVQQAFRVIVDEIPAYDPTRQGMQFVLRYSIPVFVQPEGKPPAPRLQARLIQDGAGPAMLEVHNSGDGQAQVADLAVLLGQRSTPLLPGLVGYVLPGQTMRWALQQAPAQLAGGIFSARINGGSQLTPLPTTPPAR